MRYEVLSEKNNYALIVRKIDLDEYAVVYGLNKEEGYWAHTCSYYNFSEYSSLSKEEALMYALDAFLCKTKENYISRYRLEELATKMKDGLMEDDEVSAIEYFNETCEMEDYEKEFFGVPMNYPWEEDDPDWDYYNDCPYENDDEDDEEEYDDDYDLETEVILGRHPYLTPMDL